MKTIVTLTRRPDADAELLARLSKPELLAVWKGMAEGTVRSAHGLLEGGGCRAGAGNADDRRRTASSSNGFAATCSARLGRDRGAGVRGERSAEGADQRRCHAWGWGFRWGGLVVTGLLVAPMLLGLLSNERLHEFLAPTMRVYLYTGGLGWCRWCC